MTSVQRRIQALTTELLALVVGKAAPAHHRTLGIRDPPSSTPLRSMAVTECAAGRCRSARVYRSAAVADLSRES